MAAEPTPFHVGYVRGVTPAKWARIWAERRPDRPLELQRTDADQTDVLRLRTAQMAFVRLPIEPDGLNLIPLYDEVAVVVVPKEHPVAAVETVTLSDLDGEKVHGTAGDIEEIIAVVAAGAGVVIVPQSIARLHARRDLTYRPVTDAPPTGIALAWLAEPSGDDKNSDSDAAAIDEFIGIVRGRTVRSSRSEPSVAAEERPKKDTKKTGTKAAPGARRRPPAGRASKRFGGTRRQWRHR